MHIGCVLLYWMYVYMYIVCVLCRSGCYDYLSLAATYAPLGYSVTVIFDCHCIEHFDTRAFSQLRICRPPPPISFDPIVMDDRECAA